MTSYIPGAFVLLWGVARASLLMLAYMRTPISERPELTRPLVLGLLDSAGISLVGLLILTVPVDDGFGPAQVFIYALGLVVAARLVLRWRWRKSFPPPGPESVPILRLRFRLTGVAGVVFLGVQAVLFMRNNTLTGEGPPMWPSMVAVALLVTAFVEYRRLRSAGR